METLEMRGFVDLRIDCCQDLTPHGIFRMCEAAWNNGVVKWCPAVEVDNEEIFIHILKSISDARIISRYIASSIPGVFLKSPEQLELGFVEKLGNLGKLVKIISHGASETVGEFEIVDASIGLISPSALEKQIELRGPQNTVIVTSGAISALKAFQILVHIGFNRQDIVRMMSENPASVLKIEKDLEDCSVTLVFADSDLPIVRKLYLNGALIIP